MSHAMKYAMRSPTEKATGQVRPAKGIAKVSRDAQQNRTWPGHKRSSATRLLMNSPGGRPLVRTGQAPGRSLRHAIQSPHKKTHRGVK
jgi:hypothetical protein